MAERRTVPIGCLVCRELVWDAGESRCPQHRLRRRDGSGWSAARPPADPRYQSAAWRDLRRRVVEGKACATCGRPAQHADHIVPVRLGGDFFDPANLRPLCQTCHMRRTAGHSRFGKPRS